MWAQPAPRPIPPPQPVEQADINERPTFTSETKEVTLYVSVLDRDGKLITDIPQSSFKVTENNIEQPIKLFKREDVPVSMCILIDSSGSMREKHSSVVSAALALVKASNKDDEVCFVNFNDDAVLDQPFTNSIEKLEAAMEGINSRGGTAMRNAISATIHDAMKDAKRDKKVIVVVTDGNDNASNETSLEDLVRQVRDSEVLVYTIGLLNDEERGEARKAKRALDTLAEASGGFAYYPKDLAEVQTTTPQIAHEIRNQYILAYSPTNEELDGSFRKIKVEVKGTGRGSTVRTRTGYYATPTGKIPVNTARPPLPTDPSEAKVGTGTQGKPSPAKQR
jgi:VWFA-related protein